MSREMDSGWVTLLRFLGVAGVDYDENKKAHYWGRWFAWPMLALAVWLVIQWVLESHHIIDHKLASILVWLIWGAFVVETATLTMLVDHKVRYLRHNWMNLLIIFTGLPALWGTTPMTAILRGLRLVIILRILINWWRS